MKRMRINIRLLAIGALLALVVSCRKTTAPPVLFAALPADSTGLHFANVLTDAPDFNLFQYMYYYNGAGVGAGDFNGDGKADLFFAANQHANALYLNKGQLRFEEVSKAAGLSTDSAWSTGVSVVDINADGKLDIYVCRVGQYKKLRGKNQLLINQGNDAQGIPQFKDEAAAYGLDFSGFSTQAAFFDMDLDGDLDMFLLNHSVNHDGNYAPRSNFIGTYDSLAGQRLYRNDSRWDTEGRCLPRFSNITQTAGINGSRIGYGLGVAISDVNLDGLPDIYVGNDFHENDYLYINQGNGVFSEESNSRLQHSSQFSMGVDAADINNDGMPDVVSMDMLPYQPDMLRRSLSEDDYNIFQHKLRYGYSYQYARNNLQLNLGDGQFAEIGQYAGIYATDWTWSALLMDFDNDGWKDLFVSNGIPKRMNDIDYISFVSGEEMQQKLRNNSVQQQDLALLNRFPEIKLPNQFFSNNQQLQFSNVSTQVTGNQPSFSNGAAYADLDNDGDLDIVVNNINDKVLLYENKLDSARSSSMQLQLQGPAYNTAALGSKLLLFSKTQTLLQEVSSVHGFLSSMQVPLHIGLGKAPIDSAVFIWPDGSYQTLSAKAGTTLQLQYKPGLPQYPYTTLRQRLAPAPTWQLADISRAWGLQHAHVENVFNEFDREALMPRMVSAEGPALAVADINHDGLDDLFVGGSKSYPAAVFLQTHQQRFVLMPQPALAADSMWEATDASWLDVNGDTHLDLLVATGGNEYFGEDEHLQPCLYLNDGTGALQKKADAFPGIYSTQSRLLPLQLNADRHPDLLITGRAVPWQYGASPRSYLLQNDGRGRYTDVTSRYAPELLAAGMITDACIADLNGDRQPDLVLAQEWGGIVAALRKGDRYEWTTLYAAPGWWQSLLATDADGDGDVDLIAGNYGLNNRLHASEQTPVRLYVNDFDGNGRTETVMSYYLQGQEIPFASKLQLEKQMPILKKKFLYAADFAKASLPDLLGADKLKSARQLSATQMAHVLLLNDGKGQFTAAPLPAMAQWSAIRCIVPVQANGDALPDYLLLGNYSHYHVELGRQDANTGLLLINKGGGKLQAQALSQSPLQGEIRKAASIQLGSQRGWAMARNNGSTMLLTAAPVQR